MLKMKLLAALACAAIALAAPATARAAALYVRTDGSDANDGLTNSPQGAFQTIQSAVSRAQPGDVVEIQSGVYNEGISVSVAGTADQHITIRGNGQVVLDGGNTLGYAIVTGDNAQFVDFENLEIRNYTVIAFYFHSYDNRFTNLDVHHNARVAEGHAYYDYPYTGYGRQTFVNCKFHHHALTDLSGGDPGMIRAYYASGIAFEHCEFYENTTVLVLALAHTQDTSTIRNCVFRDNSGSGIGSGDLIGSAIVENNTFYGNGGTALSTWDDQGQSVKIWRNNVAVRNGFGYGKAVGWDQGTVTAENNLAFANRDGDFGAFDVASGNLTADPLFVNEATRDLRLAGFSPAIDQGLDVGLPFFGAAPDLGAFEKTTVDLRLALDRAPAATAEKEPSKS